MPGPVATLLDGGERLHLQHGPIDLIIGADAESDALRLDAFQAAARCFDGLLQGLVDELDLLRSPSTLRGPLPSGPVAKRMIRATHLFCAERFMTPMIAVAGAVADTVLEAMVKTTPLHRAYVNNGGDIALHLAKDACFNVLLAAHSGERLGSLLLQSGSGVRGAATSGRHGRSMSLGIADSVTVLATNAATADAAATLIANAVDLPGHAGIHRCPAIDVDPDSDLGGRQVVTAVSSLSNSECTAALDRGSSEAQRMLNAGTILGAALFLQGHSAVLGTVAADTIKDLKELSYA